VKDGHALLRFGEASQPVVRFDSTPGGEYDDGVQKRLERLGTRLGGAGASDHARAKFEAAGASRPK
jgi:hypothetical protein